MGTLVFVYGTLKQGKRNHHVLGDSIFVRTDKAPGELFTGPHFPMAVPNNKKQILGEVFDVNSETMKRLDRLEGHPFLYKRESVQLASGDKAEIYYWQGDSKFLKACPSGVWH